MAEHDSVSATTFKPMFPFDRRASIVFGLNKDGMSDLMSGRYASRIHNVISVV